MRRVVCSILGTSDYKELVFCGAITIMSILGKIKSFLTLIFPHFIMLKVDGITDAVVCKIKHV